MSIPGLFLCSSCKQHVLLRENGKIMINCKSVFLVIVLALLALSCSDNSSNVIIYQGRIQGKLQLIMPTIYENGVRGNEFSCDSSQLNGFPVMLGKTD
jgi:hypothetical protein